MLLQVEWRAKERSGELCFALRAELSIRSPDSIATVRRRRRADSRSEQSSFAQARARSLAARSLVCSQPNAANAERAEHKERCARPGAAEAPGKHSSLLRRRRLPPDAREAAALAVLARFGDCVCACLTKQNSVPQTQPAVVGAAIERADAGCALRATANPERNARQSASKAKRPSAAGRRCATQAAAAALAALARKRGRQRTCAFCRRSRQSRRARRANCGDWPQPPPANAPAKRHSRRRGAPLRSGRSSARHRAITFASRRPKRRKRAATPPSVPRPACNLRFERPPPGALLAAAKACRRRQFNERKRVGH